MTNDCNISVCRLVARTLPNAKKIGEEAAMKSNCPSNTSDRRLSRALVIEAAIAILDEAGMEGLSARGIASRLGRSTMAMYRHVASMDEVIMLAAETVERAPAENEVWPCWEAQLEAFLTERVDDLIRHPWLIDFHVTQGTGTTVAAKQMAKLIQMIQTIGLRDGEAAAALRTIWSTVVGIAIAWRQLNRLKGWERVGSTSEEGDRFIAFATATAIDGLRAAVSRANAAAGAGSVFDS